MRHYYRCHDCLSVATTEKPIEFTTHKPSGMCRPDAQCACGGWLYYLGEVRQSRIVFQHTTVPCDSRCTKASGPSCNCSCGGNNHGSGILVDITVDAGSIPRLAMANHQRGEDFRALYDRIKDRIQALYGELFRAKMAGRWIHDWNRYREGCERLDTLRDISAMKNWKSRQTRLEQYGVSIGV